MHDKPRSPLELWEDIQEKYDEDKADGVIDDKADATFEMLTLLTRVAIDIAWMMSNRQGPQQGPPIWKPRT